MPQNMERAADGGWLWPPIADALDTYLRRRLNDAAPYEQVWRLIHLWEASAITLALASLSRVRTIPELASLYLRQREHFHGLTWDDLTRGFKESQGAAHGSIEQWLNVLDSVTKTDSLPGSFLPALAGFLKTECIDLGALVSCWAKACDVPQDTWRGKPVTVLHAMRHVNVFRNRFAHVPFPHDPLAELATGLELVTEQMFSVEPRPESHEVAGASSPLTGAFRLGRRFLKGVNQAILAEDSASHLDLVFPVRTRSATEAWPGESFFYCDGMSRPHIVTRVKGFDVAEYTRFRAEANAIFVKENAGIGRLCPRPEVRDYAPDPEPDSDEAVSAAAADPHEVQASPTMAGALEAIRVDDFEAAIRILESIVESRPHYHVGWLRLGHAQREHGVRLGDGQKELAIREFEKATEALSRAMGHVEDRYKALAFYERSKTYFQLYRLTGEAGAWKASREDAMQACVLSPDERYQTWLQYVEGRKPLSPAQPVGVGSE